MDQQAVYRKTEMGQEEIRTRAAGLPAKLRSVLILVDGKTPLAGLLARSSLSPEAYPQLERLLAEGYIEAVDAGAITAPPPVAAVTVDLAAMKRDLCRALLDLMGPDADPLTLRVERARSLAEFRDQAQSILQLLAASRGARAAERVRASLDVGVLS